MIFFLNDFFSSQQHLNVCINWHGYCLFGLLLPYKLVNYYPLNVLGWPNVGGGLGTWLVLWSY